MSRVRRQDTTPELVVRSLLHRLGYRFRLHREDLPAKPDIVLPKYKLVIWVHGCFWHGHDCRKGRRPKTNRAFWEQKLDRNRERDKQAQSAISALGWRYLIVWECDTFDEEALEHYLARELEAMDVC